MCGLARDGYACAICSERACPALGGEAPPNQTSWIYLELGGAFIGAASPPSAGQARSLQLYGACQNDLTIRPNVSIAFSDASLQGLP